MTLSKHYNNKKLKNMKKILFSIIALISMATTAKADGLVLADVGIQPGKTATV